MKGNSIETRTKADKISALAGKLAVNIARQHNDPLYKKYTSAHVKLVKLKDAITKKYGTLAMSQARSGGAPKKPAATTKTSNK